MTVYLRIPYAGQAVHTLYTGPDEAALKAAGLADDYTKDASDYGLGGVASALTGTAAARVAALETGAASIPAQVTTATTAASIATAAVNGAQSDLAKRVRTDTAAQALSDTEKANARANIDTRSTSETTFASVAEVQAAQISAIVQRIRTRSFTTGTVSRRGGGDYNRSTTAHLTGFTFSGTTTKDSTTVTSTLASLRVVVGGPIAGPGIPAGTIVTASEGMSFTISQPATASGTGTMSVPVHAGYTTSADGAVWVLSEDRPNLWQFGGKEGSGNRYPLQHLFDYVASGASSVAVIPPLQSNAYFEYTGDVWVLASGITIEGMGGSRSRLLAVPDASNNLPALRLGRAVIAGYDAFGKLIEGGAKADGVVLKNFAIKSFGGQGALIIQDYCDHVVNRDMSVSNLTNDGSGVTTAWRVNWCQWATWEGNCSSGVNGPTIEFNLAASITENEDHYKIDQSCNFSCAKTRSLAFMPAIYVVNVLGGAALPQTADITAGTNVINFAVAPVKLDGTALGNGTYLIDGPGIPAGAVVTVGGTGGKVGTISLPAGVTTMDPTASPNATASTPGATVNLHVRRTAPMYQLDMGAHCISAMDGATVTTTTVKDSKNITLASASSSLRAFMHITGPGIQDNTTVQSVNGTAVVLSKAATADASGVTLTVANDNNWSGGLRIVNPFPGTTAVLNPSFAHGWFENIDYPIDAKRFATDDRSNFNYADCSTLQAKGAVWSTGPNATVSYESAQALQCNVLVDGPVVFGSGRMRLGSITTLSLQSYNRIHLANKGPCNSLGFGSSMDGLTLKNTGTVSPATGATSAIISGVTLSALPDILQASPSFDHGGWWFGAPTISGVTASGGGTVSVTLNWKNAAPAGATIGWVLEVADAS